MGLFGKALESAVREPGEEVDLYIEGIIARDSITQFFAPDGHGKSNLLLQAELECVSNVDVYGEYEVREGIRVVHIQTERSARETYQRMIHMMQKIPIAWDRFYFESTLQGYDISEHKDRVAIIARLKNIREEFGGIDWIHIDPIYAWTSADIGTSAGAGHINDLLRKIQKDVCSTISYNHHPNRGIKDLDTGKRKGEDMYGNRFLSANCTGVFSIKKNDTGTTWVNIKDSWSCLASKIELAFDAQHYMSYVDSNKSFVSKADRILSFLKVCKSKTKSFSFDDFKLNNDVSTAYARRQLSRHIEIGNISVVNPGNRKHLYESKVG